jgi:hypothetical protein
MAYLNVNVPLVECFIREEFLRDMQDGHGKKHECIIFGMSSIAGKTPLFHCLLTDGGIWWKQPIHAFCWKESTAMELDELVLWDSFSYYPSVTEFSFLKSKKMFYKSRRSVEYAGEYLFTIDWAGEDSNMLDVSTSEVPGQHKCGHVIKLDNGNFAIQPNNRMRLFEPSTTTRWGETVVDRKLNTRDWSVEQSPKWVLEDTDAYEYEIKEGKHDK